MADDLRRLLGETTCAISDRPLDLAVRAHDASHYLLHPRAVATPRDAGQVGEVMRACTRLGVPLTFRGGGTSLSGQSLSDSLLVDTRSGFEGVEVLDEGRRLRVEPGVTVRRANAHLAAYGRRLGPDPASEIACTIGGVVANNSSGMQCGTRLSSYATLDSLVLVLASGTVVDSAAADADAHLARTEPHLHAGLLALRERIRGDSAAVATLRRLFAIKNTMGYGLNSFLDHDEPVQILARLMVGSEGTLGFVASAVFRTVEVLPHAATGLLVLPDLSAAADAVAQVSEAGVVTAELLDAASLRVAQADPACPAAIAGLEVGARAALLVEVQAASAAELAELVGTAERGLTGLPLAVPAALTDDRAERAALWRTRKGLFSAVAGARAAGTNALLEDVAVPVPQLGDLSRGLVGLFDDHGYEESVIFGHARDGNVHFLLAERFDDQDCLRRYEAFTTDMVDLVLGLGGTLKAEHGTGRIMAPFVERQYGAQLTGAMHELKALLDPAGILNPGNVLTNDPRAWLRNLKTSLPVEVEVDRCVECGFCEPVCPSRSLTMTPRQRIVARREMARARSCGDQQLADRLSADYDYDGVQTCAADGMCATACPVHIDTGDLVRRLRAESTGPVQQRVWAAAAHHWEGASRAGSRALTLAARAPRTAAAASRAARSAVGTEQAPLYAPGLDPGGPARAVIVDPDAEAVLFAACVQTMFGGGVTASLLRLCERADVRLRTPSRAAALCCGTPWKSKGQLDGYHRMRELVTQELQTATDGGRLPVVVDASSCAEGLELLVAAAGFTVVDAITLVADRLLDRLPVTRPVPSVAVHPTCSTTAIGSTDALVALARACVTPGGEVAVPTAWGCCAFAGDRGLLHPELTAAATAPEADELAGREFAAYVSANRTCEIGMTRATGQPYRHVLTLLDQVTSG